MLGSQRTSALIGECLGDNRFHLSDWLSTSSDPRGMKKLGYVGANWSSLGANFVEATPIVDDLFDLFRFKKIFESAAIGIVRDPEPDQFCALIHLCAHQYDSEEAESPSRGTCSVFLQHWLTGYRSCRQWQQSLQ
ncbi:hypothetical protein V3C99_000027 [Haemonchus contortus]